MLRNYFTIALRQLRKHRFYTLVNVFGLTIGITACLIIFLYVRFELSYDRFHENADRIVRVDWEVFFGETLTYNAAVTPPMAEVMARDYPEVEAAVRLYYIGSARFRKNAENVVEPKVVYADNDVFRVFTLPFIAGNPNVALKDPQSMVVSETFAAKFFPGESALNKTLVKDNKTLYTITGIIKDLPQNSHFHYDVFLSMESRAEAKNGNWIGQPFNTYLLLRPGTNAKELEKKFPTLVSNYVMPYAASMLGGTFIDQFQANKKNHLTLHVRPLTDIHLYSHLRNELEGNGDIKYVFVFSVIAIFILAIACINFMNLATARSAKRAREVGVRKVMGSTRRNLVFQFLLESWMLSIVSFLLALALADLLLPAFNAVMGMRLTVPYTSPALMIGLACAAVLVGFAAGIYPGMVLSGFRPAEVIKGKLAPGIQSSFLHRGLVIFQFTISIFLTIATLAVYSQMEYMKQVNLGFRKEQVIRMRDVQNAGDRLYNFREEMLRHPMIRNATVSSYFPGPGSARNTPLIWRYGSGPQPENAVNIEKWLVDEDYVSTLGMEIIMGRNFSKDFPSDSSAVVLNEAALPGLRLGADPIGQKVSLMHQFEDGTENSERLDTYTVIGVVKDFNFESLRQGVSPLGLFLGKSTASIAFRYETSNTQEVIDALKKNWNRIAPGEPFTYGFLDADFDRMFTTEKKLGQIFVLFTTLAIVIACLGLFALTAFTAEQRTKEIGIRKVLGASVSQVILLLTASFGRLILVSFFIAVPLAVLGNQWYLQQYAYRTEISSLIYIGSGVLAFLIAMGTMGFQCIRAAQANPVDSLKHE
jgi:putative ABC transport system permease protein